MPEIGTFGSIIVGAISVVVLFAVIRSIKRWRKRRKPLRIIVVKLEEKDAVKTYNDSRFGL